MSLIDEALKRAQAAHQGETRPSGGERPWTPVPLPDRSQANRRRTFLAIGLAALAIVLSGALLLTRQAPKSGPPLPAGEGRGEGRPKPASAPLPTPLAEAIVAPPSRGVPAAPARGPAAPADPRVAANPVPAAASAAPAPAPPHHAGALVNGHTYVGTITLPGGGKIELEGIVYSESHATALINGRPMADGGYVEGFTIVRIEPARVELEGNGLTIFLTPGK